MLTVRLAWRNLWRNPRRSSITLGSIAFAVVVALWVESMTRGSHEQMITNMTRYHTGTIQLQHPDFRDEPSLDNALVVDDALRAEVASAHEGVGFLVPRLETFMLAAGDDTTRGAQVLGVDLAAEHRLNGLRDYLVRGRFFAPDEQAVVLGQGLAQRLDLEPGDDLILLGQGRFGQSAAGRYPVAGLIEHPMRDIDNQRVYLPIAEARWLLSAEQHATALLVEPDAPHLITPVAESLQAGLAHREGEAAVTVLTWRELMPDLVQALEFDAAQQKLMTGILYLLIGFGLFGTLLMMLLERRREFSILISIGMQRRQLAFMVFLESLLLSGLGAVAGLVPGGLLVAWFVQHPIPLGGDVADMVAEMGMGLEAQLEFSAAPSVFWSQTVQVLALAVAVGLYPVWKIHRIPARPGGMTRG